MESEDHQPQIPHPAKWVVPVVGSTLLVGAVFWMVNTEGFTAATLPTMLVGVLAIMALDTVVKQGVNDE